MLPILICACVVLLSSPAVAIRWDFDDGTTQGWGAKKSFRSGSEHLFYPLSGVVEAGVWRINLFRTDGLSEAGTDLISPTIGYDSHLFDRVRVRFRSVHHSPTTGALFLRWTNELNLMYPGNDPLVGKGRFSLGANGIYGELVYTTEWQEFEFSLVDMEKNYHGYYPLWEGLLDDIRLTFGLESMTESMTDRLASTKVSGLEVDWIELTGVEELLQGELPRPSVFDVGFAGLGVFAPPAFYPIVPELGRFRLLGDSQEGVLIDLDGDGDLDLFSFFRSGRGGWVMAGNNGAGAFETVRVEELKDQTRYPRVRVGDVTGDGRDEIVMSIETNWELGVWSIGEEFQLEELVQRPNRRLVDLADWDGDGQVEVFAQPVEADDSFLEVWDLANGVWTFSEWAVPGPASGVSWAHQIGDFTGNEVLDVLWGPGPEAFVGRERFEQAISFRMAVLGADPGQGVLFEEVFPFSLLAGRAGDFDGDGQVDLLAGLREDFQEQRKGLAVWSSLPNGLKQEVIYDEHLFLRSSVEVCDLNGDGVDDWVFIGGDYALGFGVFVEWGGGLHLTKEVEWHRLSGDGVDVGAGGVATGLEGNGVRVLLGDVDGDGDVDLVVLDRALGGVHVLKSSVSEQMTAVLTSEVERPVQYRLGDSYPNPFNPAVVLPFDLATDAARVSLMVYDMLGRRVRQVWQGPLGRGSYRFVWDGCDEAGKAVATGVYIYQVEVDGQTEAKKTTKLP